MKKNNGFTLIELLAVVIILLVISFFVMPQITNLIKKGNNTEIKLIEQKALTSARNYVNNYDTNFLNHFIEEGYEKTVFKDDLIESGLMSLEEVSKIEDFRGVNVTLLENDKLEYTISRLSDTRDYTNEELYQMIQELSAQASNNNTAYQNQINSLSTQVSTNNTSLQNQINSLSTQVANSNIFLKSYPVGSIYVSTISTNPGSSYGGTWKLLSKKVIDTGWQNFSWTNSTYIGTSQSSYTQNKWRVIDNILYIQVGVGATETIDTATESEIARIPIIGNTSYNSVAKRIWNGAVGGGGVTAGFFVVQEGNYISVKVKPHNSSIGTTASWYSTSFSIPLDDSFSFTAGTYTCKYTWERTA